MPPAVLKTVDALALKVGRPPPAHGFCHSARAPDRLSRHSLDRRGVEIFPIEGAATARVVKFLRLQNGRTDVLNFR